MDLNERLAELSVLQPGWHNGDGATPTAVALGLAAVIGHALAPSSTDNRVRAYPTPDGGISLEWRQDDLSHCATIGPWGRLDLLTVDPADTVPADPPHRAAARALLTEAAAMDRLQEQLAWTVRPNPEPRLDAPTLRAVATLLETLEPE
jgi:hypothetical protein